MSVSMKGHMFIVRSVDDCFLAFLCNGARGACMREDLKTYFFYLKELETLQAHPQTVGRFIVCLCKEDAILHIQSKAIALL